MILITKFLINNDKIKDASKIKTDTDIGQVKSLMAEKKVNSKYGCNIAVRKRAYDHIKSKVVDANDPNPQSK